jgi:hypothetical protein
VIATDAALTKAECKRLAIAAHDGFARAIWPCHTPMDGDLVFAVSTGKRKLEGDSHARSVRRRLGDHGPRNRARRSCRHGIGKTDLWSCGADRRASPCAFARWQWTASSTQSTMPDRSPRQMHGEPHCFSRRHFA